MSLIGRRFAENVTAPKASPVPVQRSSGVMSERLMKMLAGSEQNEQAVKTALDNVPVPEMTRDDLLVDDIDFDGSRAKKQVVTTTDVATKRQRAKEEHVKRQEHGEERTRVSHDTVLFVNHEAKRLARKVDEFIGHIRGAAEKSHDNSHLLRRLEMIRRTCIGFVGALENQLPSQVTGMFVEEQ